MRQGQGARGQAKTIRGGMRETEMSETHGAESETTAEERAAVRKKYAVQLALVFAEHPGSATAELIDTYEGELCRLDRLEAQLAEAVGLLRELLIEADGASCDYDYSVLQVSVLEVGTFLASLEKHE